MTFYTHAYLTSKVRGTPEVQTEEIELLAGSMKGCSSEQLEHLFALIMQQAAVEGRYVIGAGVPYNGTTLDGNYSPKISASELSPMALKLIRAFFEEINRISA